MVWLIENRQNALAFYHQQPRKRANSIQLHGSHLYREETRIDERREPCVCEIGREREREEDVQIARGVFGVGRVLCEG